MAFSGGNTGVVGSWISFIPTQGQDAAKVHTQLSSSSTPCTAKTTRRESPWDWERERRRLLGMGKKYCRQRWPKFIFASLTDGIESPSRQDHGCSWLRARLHQTNWSESELTRCLWAGWHSCWSQSCTAPSAWSWKWDRWVMLRARTCSAGKIFCLVQLYTAVPAGLFPWGTGILAWCSPYSHPQWSSRPIPATVGPTESNLSMSDGESMEQEAAGFTMQNQNKQLPLAFLGPKWETATGQSWAWTVWQDPNWV